MAHWAARTEDVGLESAGSLRHYFHFCIRLHLHHQRNLREPLAYCTTIVYISVVFFEPYLQIPDPKAQSCGGDHPDLAF